MSYKIIGNTEYKSINEKAYINGSQDDIMRLAQELDRVGINYSGRISEYRSAITVAAADRVKAIEIMNGLMRKDESSLANAEKNIIGNAEYRYIANKRYIKGETEAMLRTADRLTAENISFSGRINGNTVTLTVSGDEMQERVKKYFSEEINREQTIQSVYLLFPASDGYEDGYYISEVNANTGEEISPYRSSYGDIPMFVSVDEAIRYTQNAGIALSNTEAQFADWRKTEEEKERQMLLERSREIIRQLPMSGKEYEEHFIFRDNAIDWIYFNPDGNDSEGEFVETTIYAADIINAYKERVASSDNENGRNNFLETIIHSCEQRIIEAGTEDFESYAHHFVEASEGNNVLKTFGIYENSDYIQNIDTVINRLEEHFEEVRSYTENVIEQLYELAQKELEDFENSLDTAEKAKAAAYELSVKRDILSYIHSDLSNDISDSDTEDACRRLISSGYPLDTFYQDWLKNEYDNRMEAVKMTAADSLRKETQHFGIIENAQKAVHSAELPEKNNFSYSIYQIPSGERYRDIRFASYNDLDKMGQLPDSLNYKKVYSGNLDDIKYDNKLEGIFVKFNTNPPKDFEGHSLSVSDVVVIETEDNKKAYFVDDTDYKDISDIFLNLNHTEQQKENSPVENREPPPYVTITCNYSESSAFEDGKTYSVAEFDRIMAEADAERVNGWNNGLKKYGNENIWEYNDSESYYKYIGYEKTSFTINFPNGETVSERQDIGDGYGGVIDYCRTFSSLQKYIPILETQRELDNTIRERDEHTAVHQELEKDQLEMEGERAVEKEEIVDDNNIQSEQLSFFSASPSRRSIDEALSELSDTPEEQPESHNDGLLTFAEQVDKVLNGTANRYNDLKVCDTPQILLDVGCEQLPMLYTQQHLRKAIQPKNLTEHTHGLDIAQVMTTTSSGGLRIAL